MSEHRKFLVQPPAIPRRKDASNFVRLFRPLFAPLVETGAKTQTVRPTPKRMPRPGDTISLRTWTGKPRQSKQRILRESVITRVAPCAILPWQISVDGKTVHANGFAYDDGFEGGWPDMRNWFMAFYRLPFAGIVIYWTNAEPGHNDQSPCI